jgi:CxxC-x17-CxxC domain-containing protein
MYKVICSDCGKEAEVPFRPTRGRPVYCRECFQKRRLPRHVKHIQEPSTWGRIIKWIVALCVIGFIIFFVISKFTVNEREVEMEVFKLINEKRSGYGLLQLQWDSDVAAVARSHSQNMAEHHFFAHENPQDEGPDQRLAKNGIIFNMAGEVIHQQDRFYLWISFIPIPKTQDQIAGGAVDGWMNSPPHRGILLDSSLTRIGVGVWSWGTTYYFTADLIG